MMDDVFGVVLVLLVGAAAMLGCMFLVSGSLDSTVVEACKKNGYWQTGQTRIICTVEERK
jgi:hypothetical protein